MTSTGKRRRQAKLLEIIRDRRVPHQEALRELAAGAGFPVAQATLSRDIRDMRLVKVKGAGGVPYYTLPEEWDHVPPLDSILPKLFVAAEAIGNLVIVRTLSGAAQTVASGIDWEEYEGVAGTIAGDDTALIIVRGATTAGEIVATLSALAGKE